MQPILPIAAVVIQPDGGTVAPGPIELRAERELLRLLCSKRTGDPGNREPPEMFGARVPVVQRKEDPADEDNRRNQDEVGLKPGRPEQGEERIAPKSRQRTGHPAEARQVCYFLVCLWK
jgi:hypothetical protein